MFNIKLTIEYEGTKYCGWQRQIPYKKKTAKNKKMSIQEVVENSLKRILKQQVHLIGSGRTDSGVHALGQVANFKTSQEINLDKLRRALNANLPKDIRIIKAEEVLLGFHSRFSAQSKRYRYLILNQEYSSAFFKKYFYWFRQKLNIQSMRKAAGYLLGRHDFKAFCASGSSVKNTFRTIKSISIKKIKFFSCRLICIEIEADGFLYNMTRNIVGTLIEVGRKRFEPDYIAHIIRSKNRAMAGPCVPPCGLFLVEVKY